MKVDLSRDEISLIRFCLVVDAVEWNNKLFTEQLKANPKQDSIRSFKSLHKDSSDLHKKFIGLSKEVSK